ncbi:MAG: transcription antitermination factor NusB [Betaproteobacteria bacterium]|nr:transcription antitermination factor NusB [Betaproteobacteria bacterium]
MKSARRRAREGLVQGLYQWQLTGHEAPAILGHIVSQEHFPRADQTYFAELLPAVMAESAALDEALRPFLDREPAAVSPIERAILWIAAFELRHRSEMPFRVIINEAVELAKMFGGTDGHKYVNGVLDRLAAQERPEEINTRTRGRG